MKKSKVLSASVVDLLYQSLETELGGVEIYRTALECARNKELTKEWEKYLDETENHLEIMRGVLADLQLDPEKDTPGRAVVRHIGKSLCKAMQLAKGGDDPATAELVAAECVTLAETKDHLNWELLSKVSEGRLVESRVLAEAVARIEDEEDEHLYHTSGWTRELWIKALGMKAVLPPPEEKREVKTMGEAALAKEERTEG
ncbi:MAG: hypothetical protein ABIP94_03350 [Planctomycetota bacterium]